MFVSGIKNNKHGIRFVKSISQMSNTRGVEVSIRKRKDMSLAFCPYRVFMGEDGGEYNFVYIITEKRLISVPAASILDYEVYRKGMTLGEFIKKVGIDKKIKGVVNKRYNVNDGVINNLKIDIYT